MAALVLGGCGPAAGSKPGQVAAHVNKGEVSLHQVRYVLDHQPRLAAQQPEAAPRLVLASLVEQELAAQAAREQGLDNDPAYVQGMEVARRELLARMYQERLAAKAEQPGTDEIDRYYDAHPALFAERRLYTLREFAVQVPPDGEEAVRSMVKSAGSEKELQAALEQSGLPMRTGVTVLAPEAVPLQELQTLAALHEGQSMVRSKIAGGLHVWTLLQTQAAPVDRKQAREAISTYLLTERKRQLVQNGMAALRKNANIAYAGEFAAAQAPTSAR